MALNNQMNMLKAKKHIFWRTKEIHAPDQLVEDIEFSNYIILI